MALLHEFTNDMTGVSFPDAYWRISRVEISVNDSGAAIFVSVYKDRQARLDGKSYITEMPFRVLGDDFDCLFSIESLDKEGTNPIKQGYIWLKTQSIFNDATDV